VLKKGYCIFSRPRRGESRRAGALPLLIWLNCSLVKDHEKQRVNKHPVHSCLSTIDPHFTPNRPGVNPCLRKNEKKVHFPPGTPSGPQKPHTPDATTRRSLHPRPQERKGISWPVSRRPWLVVRSAQP
jgi:hypothetical protein